MCTSESLSSSIVVLFIVRKRTIGELAVVFLPLMGN